MELWKHLQDDAKVVVFYDIIETAIQQKHRLKALINDIVRKLTIIEL